MTQESSCGAYDFFDYPKVAIKYGFPRGRSLMCKWTLFLRILMRTVGDEQFGTVFRLLKQIIFLEGDRVAAIFRGVLVTVMLPVFSPGTTGIGSVRWGTGGTLCLSRRGGAGPLIATRMTFS